MVRTYYSFQVPKSSDKTYNLELMGLWGWAELATGIIVGCLPVMPKFIQHVGPRFFTSLSLRSKHEVSPAHDLKAIDETLKANAFTKIQRPFATYDKPSISKSLTDLDSPQARLHGDDLTPFTVDPSVPNSIVALEPTHLPGSITTPRRDDLEYGHWEI